GPAPRPFDLDTIEAAVLGPLRAELRHPEVIAEFVRTYHEERKRLAIETGARRAAAERRLGEVRRELDRLVDAIAKGYGDPADLGPKTRALGIERRAIEAELSAAEPAPGGTVNATALERLGNLIRLRQWATATMSNQD